jgi:alpha-D-ribose 1-methylphosphonate 5-triphosphate synthase subunit PhnG
MIVRKKRTEIMAECEAQDLKSISKLVEEHHEVKILEKPNSGLVMVKMRESAQKHLFYLGEVFVTECKVVIGETVGLGVIRGSHLKKAYFMAVVDAAYNAQITETDKLDRMLKDLGEKVAKKRARNTARILQTKVDFETLDEEVKA